MKTAKKLFSLLLVAVLLFSAVPFQASAATTVTVKFKFGEGWLTTMGAQFDEGTNISVPADITAAAEAAAPAGTHLTGWALSKTGSVLVMTSQTAANDAKYYAIYAANPHECDYSEVTVVDPNCQNAGYTRHTCPECEDYYDDTPTAKTAHSWGNWTVSKEAGEREDGEEIRTCSVCQTVETKNTGKVGQVVDFYIGNELVATKTYYHGSAVSLPKTNKIPEKDFYGWYSKVQKDPLNEGDIWDADNESIYVADYRTSSNDGLNKVTVTVHFYVNDSIVAKKIAINEYIDEKLNVSDYLSANNNVIRQVVDAYGEDIDTQFNWKSGQYYLNSGTNPATTSDLASAGDKSIIVKAYADSSDVESVYLYVHNKVGGDAVDVIPMYGFIEGSIVDYEDAQNAYKYKYNKIPSFSNTTLYDEAAWAQLCAGQKTNGSKEYYVPNGGLVVHAILTGATSTGSSKAASNPATGDFTMIEATAGIMVLAAAGLVVMMQLRKRKMI